MSFLSCIGKSRRKKKRGEQAPIERRLSDGEVYAPAQSAENGYAGKKAVRAEVTNAAQKSSIEQNADKLSDTEQGTGSDVTKLEADLEECRKEVQRLVADKISLKTRLEDAENEVEKQTTANMKLLQKIVGMEENQSMVTRSELLKMITQLEEMEQQANSKTSPDVTTKGKPNVKQIPEIASLEKLNEGKGTPVKAKTDNQTDAKSSPGVNSVDRQVEHSRSPEATVTERLIGSKPITELSGIRTVPPAGNRKLMTQEDRQLSWRLSKTEARLSQSLDENRRLREDLRDMLDSNTELQQIIVHDTLSQSLPEPLCRSVSAQGRLDHDGRNVWGGQTDDDGLMDRLVNAEQDNTRLQTAYDKLQNLVETLQDRIQGLESSHVIPAESQNIGTDTSDLCPNEEINTEAEVNTVLEKLAVLEGEQRQWRKDGEVLARTCDCLTSRIDALTGQMVATRTENENLTLLNAQLRKEVETHTKHIEQLLNEKNSTNDEHKRLLDENRKLSQQQQKRKDTNSQVEPGTMETMKQELTDIRRKYEEANRRLKEVAGGRTKSVDVNSVSPAVLAGRFRGELYDQLWSQAHHILTGRLRRDDKKSIQILTEICTETYLFCKRASRMQMDTVTSSLLSPTSHHYRSGHIGKRNYTVKRLSDELPEDLVRRLTHFRCRPSETMLNNGMQDFLNQLDYDRTRFLRHVSERDMVEISPYIRTCFELAWCMAVQDPPMYLLFKVKHGIPLDPEVFDSYQPGGRRMDHVVWPAVFTTEGGTCLQKGVALALPERQ